MLFYLREKGGNLKSIELPVVPRRGDIISTTDLKFPRYLVLRVEFYEDAEGITLHVKKFPNKNCAQVDIDGFDNIRPFK